MCSFWYLIGINNVDRERKESNYQLIKCVVLQEYMSQTVIVKAITDQRSVTVQLVCVGVLINME